ncbi:hypothetical protein RhiirA1_452676 [Rhizophagus irregularis]|uniref:Uncharacterized protein n=1 Tax=Rhizophagus irregularis TaxID=588596 RepID=A0A2I1EZ18_9GLOM|nr:hypothetical protein RhiirA1_452676 [Rhizophagus irregularis]PKY27367.1 hypothetical protein RhiirB3_443038 [Rhizophagus irregularis]
MSLRSTQSVCDPSERSTGADSKTARKGPSELEVALGVCVEMLKELIDEFKRVVQHKIRHAEVERVVETDSDEDDESDSDELEAKIAKLEVLRQRNTELEAENFDLKCEVVNLRKCNEEHGSRIEDYESRLAKMR